MPLNSNASDVTIHARRYSADLTVFFAESNPARNPPNPSLILDGRKRFSDVLAQTGPRTLRADRSA